MFDIKGYQLRLVRPFNPIAVLSKMTIFIVISMASLLAQANPAGIPISGFIEESPTVPAVDTNVDFYIYILSPTGCVLYSEQHLGKDLSVLPGNFSMVLGEGTTPVNKYAAVSPQSFDNFLKVFADDSALLTGLSGSQAGECATNQYQPAATDTRKIRIEFNTHDGLGNHVLTEYSVLRSMPYAHLAYSAQKLSGKAATDFVQINSGITGYQSRVDALVTDAANTALSSVVAGTYVAPTANSFATTPTGCAAGQYATGIAANGNLTFAAIPAASIANATTTGSLTSTDWNTFNNKLDAALADGKLWLGNASNLAIAGEMSGDASISNAGIVTVDRIKGRAVFSTAPNA